MSISTLIGVLGVGISLLFGAWGVYLALVRRYQGRVTFVSEQTIGLFDAIVKNLPDMAVLYKNIPVSPNVVLIRGSLVNTGTKDISPSMIERPISLGLPTGSNWLSASVVTASQNVKASVRVSEPCVITFDNGLLRRNEFIRFQAVAELAVPHSPSGRSVTGSPEESLKNSMKFDHRIEDTDSVKSFELWPTKGFGRRFGLYFTMVGAGLFVMILMGIAAPKLAFFNAIACDFAVGDSKPMRVIVRDMRTDSVNVRALEGKFAATMTPAEFFARCRGNPMIVRDRTFTVAVIVATSLIYILLPSILICLRLRDYWTNRKLRQLLGLDSTQSVRAPGEAHAP